LLLELSAADETGFALDVGLTEELDCDAPPLLELVAELGETTTEELDPKLLFPSTLEQLPTNQSALDEEAATDGVSGDGESSEQALNIAQVPAANKELNKTFFITFLLIPRLKLDLIIPKRHKKKVFKSVFVSSP
jgi:hypothetical protein